MLRVRTRSIRTAGIRRCGERHTAEPRVWPVGHFTASEVRILEADPDLVVDLVDAGLDDTQEQGSSDGLASKTVAALRDMATELGVDLDALEGTGAGGGVVKADIVRAIREQHAGAQGTAALEDAETEDASENDDGADPEAEPEESASEPDDGDTSDAGGADVPAEGEE